MEHFNPQQLQNYLTRATPEPLLLDVREPWEFAISHIEGAINVPMSHIPHSLDSLEPHRVTVVICHHGIRSAQVGYFLEEAGFDRIINLAGGIDAWSQQIDPHLTRY